MKIKTGKAAILFFCICLALMVGCSSCSRYPATRSNSQHGTMSPVPSEATIDEIVNMLIACPAWSVMAEDDITTREEMMNTMEEVSKTDLDILYKALVEYESRLKKLNRYDISAMSRLFVLNRYIFAVPEKLPQDQVRGFGGFVVPVDDNGVNTMWPLAVGSDGNLVLVGFFLGYWGPPYQAVAEFEYLREEFGIRK